MDGNEKSRYGAFAARFFGAHLPARRAATADLTALAQGRTSGAGKLRFVESPLFDSRQIARVYREDGLFFDAVKIENNAARALRLSPSASQTTTPPQRAEFVASQLSLPLRGRVGGFRNFRVEGGG